MSNECDKCGEHALECGCFCNKKGFGKDYWFKFRDSIYEVGKPNFSIVSNGEDENPDLNVVRISDCKFNVFIDVSCNGDYRDALERTKALCNVLNADYPFMN